MLQAGFEPAIPANGRPQTFALDRSATGIADTKYFHPEGVTWNDNLCSKE